MAQQRMPGLGLPELAGIGFAAGVLSAVVCARFAGTAGTLIPLMGVAGLIVLPALRHMRPLRMPARPVVQQSIAGA